VNLALRGEALDERQRINAEVVQFVYLLLHNEKIRNVIDTIGKKGVLLLGRFTEGRIAILERLREKLPRTLPLSRSVLPGYMRGWWVWVVWWVCYAAPHSENM
jgi:hypothetical protein